METPTFIESYQTEEYEFCDSLKEKLDTLLNNSIVIESPGLIMHGNRDNNGIANRKDISINFSFIPDMLDVQQLVDKMNEILSRYAMMYADKYPGFQDVRWVSSHVKVQKTEPKGGFHKWHSEQGPDETANRVLVWTLYLNDVPEGEGETEFLEYGIKIPAKKGLLCFFPASWTHVHRGNAVYSTTKYIATGWFQIV